MAVKKRWLTENPFDGLRGWIEQNHERERFIDVPTTTKLLDAEPDVQFRLILALARYGGLRCPSEILALRWEWVDWEAETIRIHSPKTERHEGHKWRSIPIFAELRPYLADVWDQAAAGAALLITEHHVTGTALSHRLQRLCKKVGIEPWPKPWQNLRSSRETELMERFPIHTVTRWIGNSPRVAIRHYLQVTKEHHARAVRGEAKPEARADASESFGSKTRSTAEHRQASNTLYSQSF